MAARNSGTRMSADVEWNRLATSSLIPVATKKNGMKTPKPTASSFLWKNACVIPSSRSTSLSVAPARNAPRIASSPNFDASTTKRARSRNARRTRISAVVSWSLTRSCETRTDRSAPTMATPIASTNSAKPISRTSFAPMPPDLPEKKSESSTIGATSAIEAPATITWPNGVALCRASLRIGRTIPSPVAERMIATTEVNEIVTPVSAPSPRRRYRRPCVTPRPPTRLPSMQELLTTAWWPSPFGADDQLGMLNHVDAAKRLQALASVREGRLYDLGRILDEHVPVFPGRAFHQTLVTTAHHANMGGVGENQVNWITEVVSGTTELGTHLDAR